MIIRSSRRKSRAHSLFQMRSGRFHLMGVIFSVRSFQTFRLGRYYERLREYAEAAIDEYRMEQEYQNFIQSLRDYVTSNPPRMKKVRIVHDRAFTLWELRYLSEREQKKYIDRRFVREHPMYIDSHLLAPLISIAPETVELYTDKPEHMMSRTIQNVFQERVRLFSAGRVCSREDGRIAARTALCKRQGCLCEIRRKTELHFSHRHFIIHKRLMIATRIDKDMKH